MSDDIETPKKRGRGRDNDKSGQQIGFLVTPRHSAKVKSFVNLA